MAVELHPALKYIPLWKHFSLLITLLDKINNPIDRPPVNPAISNSTKMSTVFQNRILTVNLE